MKKGSSYNYIATTERNTDDSSLEERLEEAVFVSSGTISNLLKEAENPPEPNQNLINLFKE